MDLLMDLLYPIMAVMNQSINGMGYGVWGMGYGRMRMGYGVWGMAVWGMGYGVWPRCGRMRYECMT